MGPAPRRFTDLPRFRIFVGPRLRRPWYHWRVKNSLRACFILSVLTLGIAYCGEAANQQLKQKETEGHPIQQEGNRETVLPDLKAAALKCIESVCGSAQKSQSFERAYTRTFVEVVNSLAADQLVGKTELPKNLERMIDDAIKLRRQRNKILLEKIRTLANDKDAKFIPNIRLLLTQYECSSTLTVQSSHPRNKRAKES